MDNEVPELPDGNVTLTSVKDDYSYRSYTDTEGEYFLYECRDGSGWDAYIPTGLVVYHVDKSTIRNVGGYTPYYLWTASNSINAFGDHPCFYAVPSYDQSSLDFPYNSKYIVFPGGSSVKTYSPVDWESVPTGTVLSGISYSGGKVSFSVATSVAKTLAGYVRDGKANPIAGAVVTVSKPSQAPGLQSRVIPRAPESVTATTDADGYFSIDMESFDGAVAHVSVSKSGYMPVSKDVTLGSRGARVSITLYAENDGSEAWIQYYDENADGYVFGASTFMCAMKIPAGELAAFAGRKIDKVKTAIAGESLQDAYVIAEAGGTRLLNHKIDNPVFKTNVVIDLSADNLIVPEGEDLYIGLAVRNSSTDYPIYVNVGGGNCHYASYSLNGNTQWTQLNGYDMCFSVHIEGSGTTVDPYEKYENIAAQGYNVIYPGDSFTHKSGDVFQLRLFEAPGNNKPASVEWQYDGKAVSGQSVKLTKGTHKITAKLVLTDGRKEEVDLEITAQ